MSHPQAKTQRQQHNGHLSTLARLALLCTLLLNGVLTAQKAAPIAQATDIDQSGSFTTVRPFGDATSAVTSSAVGDVNDDGYLDIIVGNIGQPGTIYLNDGSGSFPSTNIRHFGTQFIQTNVVAVGDLNNDGYVDIVAGNTDQYNVIYLNDGEGNFSNEYTFGDVAGSTTKIALGDMNGDGTLDIVANKETGKDTIYLNDGAKFPSFAKNVIFNFSPYLITAFAIGDINNDGSLDILVSFLNGGSVAYINNKDTILSFTLQLISSALIRTSNIALGDVNGDGSLDIFLANNGQSFCYINNGKGNFAAPLILNSASTNTFSIKFR